MLDDFINCSCCKDPELGSKQMSVDFPPREEPKVLTGTHCSLESGARRLQELTVCPVPGSLASPCLLPDLCIRGVFSSSFFVLSNPEAFWLSLLCTSSQTTWKKQRCQIFFLNTPLHSD